MTLAKLIVCSLPRSVISHLALVKRLGQPLWDTGTSGLAWDMGALGSLNTLLTLNLCFMSLGSALEAAAQIG